MERVDLTATSGELYAEPQSRLYGAVLCGCMYWDERKSALERFGILLLPIFLLVGLGQIYLGYIGVEHHLGFWAATAAVGAMFLFRFMLPITIGSYFGAVDVLGWPWWGGLLVAAPGLLFIAPTMIMAALEPLWSKR